MRTGLPLAKVLGHIALSPEMADYARKTGDEFWTQQVSEDFCSQVDVRNPPASMDDTWVPIADLSRLGLKPKYEGALKSADIVLTTGVDYHTDQPGPVLIWTLRNDRMWFSQRGIKGQIQPAAGDWFLFEGGEHHKMDLKAADAKKEGLVFIGASIELERIEKPLVLA